jgi:hypothetical protein
MRLRRLLYLRGPTLTEVPAFDNMPGCLRKGAVMSSEENRARVRRFYQEIDKRKLEIEWA